MKLTGLPQSFLPELPVQKDKGPDYAKESFHSLLAVLMKKGKIRVIILLL